MLKLILQSGITGQDDRSLTLEANWHLFNWPGRLVQGADVPYSTDRVVNEFPEKPWTYVSLADDESAFDGCPNQRATCG
jgi:hypothetical protein